MRWCPNLANKTFHSKGRKDIEPDFATLPNVGQGCNLIGLEIRYSYFVIEMNNASVFAHVFVESMH